MADDLAGAFGLLKIISDPKAHEAKLHELQNEHQRIVDVTQKMREAQAAHNASKEAADDATRELSKAQLDHALQVTKDHAELEAKRQTVIKAEASLIDRNNRLSDIEDRLSRKSVDQKAAQDQIEAQRAELNARQDVVRKLEAEVVAIKATFEAKLAAAKSFVADAEGE